MILCGQIRAERGGQTWAENTGCEQITSLDLRCHSEIIGVCNDIDLSLFSWVSALYKGECSI